MLDDHSTTIMLRTSDNYTVGYGRYRRSKAYTRVLIMSVFYVYEYEIRFTGSQRQWRKAMMEHYSAGVIGEGYLSIVLGSTLAQNASSGLGSSNQPKEESAAADHNISRACFSVPQCTRFIKLRSPPAVPSSIRQTRFCPATQHSESELAPSSESLNGDVRI